MGTGTLRRGLLLSFDLKLFHWNLRAAIHPASAYRAAVAFCSGRSFYSRNVGRLPRWQLQGIAIVLGVKDPWKILCIMPTRDLDQIKTAYRARAQKFHPDKALTVAGKKRYTRRFIELREAYSRAKFRARYAPDLQPLRIRRLPDLAGNALLSRDWFIALVVMVAILFEFWLISVSAEYAPHYAAHATSMMQPSHIQALDGTGSKTELGTLDCRGNPHSSVRLDAELASGGNRTACSDIRGPRLLGGGVGLRDRIEDRSALP